MAAREHRFKDNRVRDVFCIGIICVLTIVLGCMMWGRTKNVEKLEKEREELAEEYARLSGLSEESKAEYKVLTDELERAEEETRQAQEKLELYQSPRKYDNEIFYGDWSVLLYGTADEEEESEGTDSPTLSLQKDSIIMLGETVTTEPVYFYNVRAYTKEWSHWDLFQEIGFETDEVRELFQEDYYIELMLDQTESWEREPAGIEESIISNAIYYMLDENTMLCFAQDNKKIYKLSRRFREDM